MNICYNKWGQVITFPLVFGVAIIVYLGTQKQLLELILSLCGHFILILTDHLFSIPLSLLGYSVPQIRGNGIILYMVITILLNFLLLRLLRKFFILPKLSIFQSCPKKLLRVFLAELVLSLALMGFNFFYGEQFGYPGAILTVNGTFISILTLSSALAFYSMYSILKRNHELTLQQAQSAVMEDYTKRIESFYEEMRAFRHDYQNILASMQDYIDTGDIEGLHAYFHHKILPDAAVLSDDGYHLGKLHFIEDPVIKSLLYTKIIAALNHKLDFSLELTQSVPPPSMDNLALCRLLGILTDNAIEAALESDAKSLRIAILREEDTNVFILSNSTPPLPVPLGKLSEPGYSSKEGHSGLGLSSAARIIEPLENVSLSTEYENSVFRQILKIHDC